MIKVQPTRTQLQRETLEQYRFDVFVFTQAIVHVLHFDCLAYMIHDSLCPYIVCSPQDEVASRKGPEETGLAVSSRTGEQCERRGSASAEVPRSCRGCFVGGLCVSY